MNNDQYKLLLEIYNKFDEKIFNVLTISLTLLTLNFGIGYFLLEKRFTWVACFFLVISIILYSISIYMGVKNNTPLDISYLDPLTFYERNYQLDDNDFKELASVTIGYTIQSIRLLNNEKAKRFKDMLNLVMYGIISMTLSFFFLIVF